LAILKRKVDDVTELIGALDGLAFKLFKLASRMLLLVWLFKKVR